MRLNSYRFHTRWTIAAPIDRVFAVLSDMEGYPDWWREVRAVRRVDAHRAEVECRSLLPYTLRFLASELEYDEPAGLLRIGMRGDLNGVAGWTLRSHGEGTEVWFDQEVTLGKPLVRMLGVLVRPLLVANHHLMTRGGLRGLRARVASPPTSGSRPGGAAGPSRA